MEVAKYNNTVSSIGPGAIYTRMDVDIEAKQEPGKALVSEIPLNR